MRKGLALDDTTFGNCSGKIPQYWPNTGEAVTSLRLFKAWDPEWPGEDRLPAWSNIADYVKTSNAKVLVGTSISCNKSYDAMSWQWTKEFLKMLGPDHIMGVAIGNELEMLSLFRESHPELKITDECLEEIFSGGYFWEQFKKDVEELDVLGFAGTPITSVFGGYSLAGKPFIDTSVAQIGTFLRKAVKTYGKRFAFTFNFYPYFDASMKLDAGTEDRCTKAVSSSTCWQSNCIVPKTISVARERMHKLTGSWDSTLWIGETGWSSPYSPSLKVSGSPMASCPAWSSLPTLQTFYEGFLSWDLNIGGKYTPPDHVFYFTVRDSKVFGIMEHFGLVPTCEEQVCRLTGSSTSNLASTNVLFP